MLRLPMFDVVAPTTLEDVLDAMTVPGARLIAGGTDLLPNLKHRLDEPPVLVSLAAVESLRSIAVDDDNRALVIGTGVTLSALAEHPLVREHAPSLAAAAGLVASPTIRNMATLGGNIHLDTRCRYVNQTLFWRSAIGGCLKSEGDVCHVVPGGKNCVAAMSSDCVPVLISLGASGVLLSGGGDRSVKFSEYYNTDGTAHINKEHDEVMVEVRVPLPGGTRRARYTKWTVRKSIDFPLVSLALAIDLDSDASDAKITAATVVVGVLNAVPKIVKHTERVVGKSLSDPEVANTLATLVGAQAKPLDNVPYAADYRRKVIPVYLRRAIEALQS